MRMNLHLQASTGANGTYSGVEFYGGMSEKIILKKGEKKVIKGLPAYNFIVTKAAVLLSISSFH